MSKPGEPPLSTPGDPPTSTARKRSLHEAAHKIGYVGPSAGSALAEESEATRKRFEALEDSNRDVITHAGRAVLVLGALGVVYGDIGTSPLYTEQAIYDGSCLDGTSAASGAWNATN